MTGSIGVIYDLPGYEIEPGAWSSVKNVRFIDNYASKTKGHTSYVTPTVAPYFLLQLAQAQVNYWVYAGLNKVYTTDGSINIDVTRASGDYTTRPDFIWDGEVFNGIPILNNSIETPQAIFPIGPSNPLVELPNWPEETVCKVLKGFGPYLIAMNVTSGIRFLPYLVKWSNEAEPGQPPSSWDETDPTNNAGESSLSDIGGYIVDGGSLRDKFIIYRETSTYVMSLIGGRFIFNLQKDLSDTGIFSRRCFVEFDKKHCVLTSDDLIIHDGTSKVSVLTGKNRRFLFDKLALADNSHRTFLVSNVKEKEILVCYPLGASETCVEALVWNYDTNTTTFIDLPGVTDIKYGIINTEFEDLIIDANQTIDDDTSFLDARIFDPTERSMLAASPDDVDLYKMDSTDQFNGADFECFMQRTGLDFGQRRFYKTINSVYPSVEAANGTEVMVRVGYSDVDQGVITWSTYKVFTVGTDDKVDFVDENINGRFISVEYRTTGNVSWKLHKGLDIADFDVVIDGEN